MNKIFRSLIQIFLVTTCIIHICSIIYFKLNPELPEIKKYKRNIGEIVFPISFIICIKRNKGKEKLSDFGYLDEWYFFSGQSKFNKSIVGWAGHSENGSLYQSAEGR